MDEVRIELVEVELIGMDVLQIPGTYLFVVKVPPMVGRRRLLAKRYFPLIYIGRRREW